MKSIRLVMGVFLVITFSGASFSALYASPAQGSQDEGYCHSVAQEAAIAVDHVSFKKRNVSQATSAFDSYAGWHTKLYQVTVNYKQAYTDAFGVSSTSAKYKVKVFEYEDPQGFPCKIDQVTAE